MASRMYNRGMYEIINQTTNWDTGDIRVLMVDDSYSFDPDSNFVSDVSADEISTTNYVRKVLQNTTITEDDANDEVLMEADDETWTDLGPATGGPIVAGVVIFRHTGVDTTAPLITFIDFTDTQVNGGDFTVDWDDTNGIIKSTSP